jgi:acyl-CoA hydrolase
MEENDMNEIVNDRNTDGGKTPSVSAVEMTELVLPNDTNLLGNLLGGRMMHWMDIAGGMAAMRHSHRTVATISVDCLEFKHPVHVGEIVILKAKLTWVGRTSMEVVIHAFGENPRTGKTVLTNTAYFTFVALDDQGKPTLVPRITPESGEEIAEFRAAEARRSERVGKVIRE